MLPIVAALLLAASTPAEHQLALLDLRHAFATRTAWQFTAAQLPEVPGETDGGGNEMPGKIKLCIKRDSDSTCLPDLAQPLHVAGEPNDDFDDARYLELTDIKRAAPSRPILLLRVASEHSGDGNQRVATFAFGYDRGADRIIRLYGYQVRRNRNEEIRYIDRGPLAGAIISAEPTQDAPFGYWIIVNSLDRSAYHPVLRYRSTTHYQDGNPLGVIDSEMPNIEHRLGLWRAGQPLPLPAGACAHPRLIRMELWCGSPVPGR